MRIDRDEWVRKRERKQETEQRNALHSDAALHDHALWSEQQSTSVWQGSYRQGTSFITGLVPMQTTYQVPLQNGSPRHRANVYKSTARCRLTHKMRGAVVLLISLSFVASGWARGAAMEDRSSPRLHRDAPRLHPVSSFTMGQLAQLLLQEDLSVSCC